MLPIDPGISNDLQWIVTSIQIMIVTHTTWDENYSGQDELILQSRSSRDMFG